MLCQGQPNQQYPRQLYFGSQKQNINTTPTKSVNYDPGNKLIQLISHILAFELNYSPVLLSVRASTLIQGVIPEKIRTPPTDGVAF